MKQGKIAVPTASRMTFVDVTGKLRQVVRESGVADAVLYVYNPHTTAGVTINEGADPAVQRDILGVFKEIVPRHYPYEHLEGNSPAHVMASVVGSSVTVFIDNGELVLGTWQKIFFAEFDGPRQRTLCWKIVAG